MTGTRLEFDMVCGEKESCLARVKGGGKKWRGGGVLGGRIRHTQMASRQPKKREADEHARDR
jgi:hypothetical protein